jgi:hypothetical protein
VVITFWVSIFIVETALALLALPFMVIFWSRSEIKESWIAGYPNSAPMGKIIDSTKRVGSWIIGD